MTKSDIVLQIYPHEEVLAYVSFYHRIYHMLQEKI